MYLLDTNCLSELRKIASKRANPEVERWAAGVDARDLFLSAITIFEVKVGILRLERRDATQARLLASWLADNVLPTFAGRIIDVDTAIAQLAASICVPDPCSVGDALIAASARSRGLTLVTRNVADFVKAGVPLLNPWAEPPGQ